MVQPQAGVVQPRAGVVQPQNNPKNITTEEYKDDQEIILAYSDPRLEWVQPEAGVGSA